MNKSRILQFSSLLKTTSLIKIFFIYILYEPP